VNGRRAPATDPTTSLLLAAEILSPTSARYDRGPKRRFYQATRVPEYWIIDADSALFEIWHPDDERPRIVDAQFEWQPNESVDALAIDVARFFASVADGAPLGGELDEA
jgi:Uma2 family endonuclease